MNTSILTGAATAAALLAGAPGAHGEIIDVQVTIENLAPQFGTYQTPVWVGFHNGGFDLYDMGAAAGAGLERIAEDGNPSILSGEFQGSGAGTLEGLIGPGGPFAPGDTASMTFSIDTDNPMHRYFSYASMVIPSNDAFVANGDPMAHDLFAGGSFVGADFFISGADVLDAGTEVNDEIPENTAFFGQTTPDTGVVENGVVHVHLGYIGSAGNPGTPSILADPMFSGADFTLSGYPIARFTIELIPAPGALALLALAGIGSYRRRRRS